MMKRYKNKKKKLIGFLKTNKHNEGFLLFELIDFIGCPEQEIIDIIKNTKRIQWDDNCSYIGNRYTKKSGNFYKIFR